MGVVNLPPDDINEDDLHAFADGQLPKARHALVEAYLDAHPDVAQKVADYRAQNAHLHALFDPVLAEPIPERLLAPQRSAPIQAAPRRRPRALTFARAALVAASVAVGVGLGWLARGVSMAPAEMTQALLRDAISAHTVFATDERRPVEIDAGHTEDLQRWLSKRMGTEVRPPHLAQEGYRLMGGRLLASEQGPAALFVYEKTNGKRMSLILFTALDNSADVPLRDHKQDGVRAFYWLEDNIGCVVIGSMDDNGLAPAGRAAYRQLIEEPRAGARAHPT